MLTRDHWDVLVVDDEPDVLAVTRLALKPIQLYSIPIRIHECRSKAEAIKYLQNTGAMPALALAIIDVVMETEQAGLEVCEFIREGLKNRITPIVVRTGQAGKAPEREVIVRYDISTYLTKVEATNDKLYATVVSALRNYEHTFAYEGVLSCVAWLTTQTREGIVRGLPDMYRILARRDGTQPDQLQFHFCAFTDREAIAVGKFRGREAEARQLRDRIATEPARVRLDNGDQFFQHGDHVLLSLARSDGAPVFEIVGETNYRPVPDYIIRLVFMYAQSIRNQMLLTDR